MKLSILATLALMFSSGYVLAGAGAPVPERPEGGPPSGRPGAVLDDASCKSVWANAKGDPAPYIINFQMVDTNSDGKITEEEFLVGCSKGWVQEGPGSMPPASGGGQTPQSPTEQ